MANLGIGGYDRPAKLIVWVINYFLEQFLKLSAATSSKIIAAVRFIVGETGFLSMTYDFISEPLHG